MQHRRDSAGVVIVSRLVLDEFAGDPPTVVLGGSGFWAAFGAAMVSDEVHLASGVGPDVQPFLEHLTRLGISLEGLVELGPMTSRTLITYSHGDERHEVPLPDWAAHVRMRAMLSDIPELARNARAHYVFRDMHPGFWPPMLEHVARTGAILMWEIPATTCADPLDDSVRDVLAATTVLSINVAEAADLVGPLPVSATLAALHLLGPEVVVLRRGARGSVVSEGGTVLELSSAEVAAVDPTGAGNAYSGAFLAEYARSGDLLSAGLVATAAAAVAVERVGPPPDRDTARARAAELMRTIRHLATSTTRPESDLT